MLLKAGLVLLNPETFTTERIIAFQFNPETMSRALEVAGAGEGNRSQPLRMLGPPVETITLDVELDATDVLGDGKGDADLKNNGLLGALALLESLVYPDSTDVLANKALAESGALSIIPMERYLTVFIWGKKRVLPVRVTQFTVSEEDFDENLNPTRATISLGLRVLSVDDLGFDHRGGALFMRYYQDKESLARGAKQADLAALGNPNLK